VAADLLAPHGRKRSRYYTAAKSVQGIRARTREAKGIAYPIDVNLDQTLVSPGLQQSYHGPCTHLDGPTAFAHPRADNPPLATRPGRESWIDRAMRGQTINCGRRIQCPWKVDRA
jgi:hypothetical protein